MTIENVNVLLYLLYGWGSYVVSPGVLRPLTEGCIRSAAPCAPGHLDTEQRHSCFCRHHFLLCLLVWLGASTVPPGGGRGHNGKPRASGHHVRLDRLKSLFMDIAYSHSGRPPWVWRKDSTLQYSAHKTQQIHCHITTSPNTLTVFTCRSIIG